MNPTPEDLQTFERAFTSSLAGCVRTCVCGRTFYDWCNSYDWEEGEKEKLEADPKATGVDYSVETIIFEGKEYCSDCDCWHERARKLIAWMEQHDHRIAAWLTLEKQRKQAEADASPVVEGHE